MVGCSQLMGRLCSKCPFESWTMNTFPCGGWAPRPAHKKLIQPTVNFATAGQNPIPKRTWFPWESKSWILTCDARWMVSPCLSTERLTAQLLRESRGPCGHALSSRGPWGPPAAPCSLLLLLIAPACCAWNTGWNTQEQSIDLDGCLLKNLGWFLSPKIQISSCNIPGLPKATSFHDNNMLAYK